MVSWLNNLLSESNAASSTRLTLMLSVIYAIVMHTYLSVNGLLTSHNVDFLLGLPIVAGTTKIVSDTTSKIVNKRKEVKNVVEPFNQ